jgi:hypothetical protein
MPRPTLSRRSRLAGQQFCPNYPTLRERRCGHDRVCLAYVKTEMGCVLVLLRRRTRHRGLELEVRRGYVARTGVKH